MPKVFISHSREDNEIVKKLEENLRRDGAEVWIDIAKIKAGDSFIKRMSEDLEWCDILILVWTESANISKYVGHEWENALDMGKKIIPCLFDNTKRPPMLRSYVYFIFKNFESLVCIFITK